MEAAKDTGGMSKPKYVAFEDLVFTDEKGNEVVVKEATREQLYRQMQRQSQIITELCMDYNRLHNILDKFKANGVVDPEPTPFQDMISKHNI